MVGGYTPDQAPRPARPRPETSRPAAHRACPAPLPPCRPTVTAQATPHRTARRLRKGKPGQTPAITGISKSANDF